MSVTGEGPFGKIHAKRSKFEIIPFGRLIVFLVLWLGVLLVSKELFFNFSQYPHPAVGSWSVDRDSNYIKGVNQKNNIFELLGSGAGGLLDAFVKGLLVIDSKYPLVNEVVIRPDGGFAVSSYSGEWVSQSRDWITVTLPDLEGFSFDIQVDHKQDRLIIRTLGRAIPLKRNLDSPFNPSKWTLIRYYKYRPYLK